MPCCVCIALLAVVAASLTASTIEQLEARMQANAAGPVRRVVDSASVLRWEMEWALGTKRTAVVITLYKTSGRVRIQVLSHALSPEEQAEVQEQVAATLDATIIERSSPEREAFVRRAMDASSAPEPIEAEPLVGDTVPPSAEPWDALPPDDR